MGKHRLGIVLFNLGGPDKPEAVKPFLFNLFHDPAIIRLPQPFRFLLAKLISTKRAPIAQEIYQQMGGGSPIVPLTQQQAHALEQALGDAFEVKATIAMRYWHPRASQAAKEMRDFQPDHIIALPLYPQFSTTTTASSFREWQQECQKLGLVVPTSFICCYPTHPSFVKGYAELIRPHLEQAKAHGVPRILFSAHGLPEKIVKDGDPYQQQVEASVNSIMQVLQHGDAAQQGEKIDHVTCYQSRVGRLKWIGPATDEEIIRGGKDGVPLVVVPVAFVSEHSETLVELDKEYGKLATEHGVPFYTRVQALGDNAHYIAALADMCRKFYGREGMFTAEPSQQLCVNSKGCGCK